MTDQEIINLTTLDQQLHSCQKCVDAGHSITPGAIFSHPPQTRVMLIGQAPGVTEVEAKRPFNAGSGKRLFSWLEGAGWQEDDFRSRHVMTAVTKCYPGKGKNGKGDRVPSKAEQNLCRPFLDLEIKYYQPKLIILVGGLAIKLFYPAKMKLVDIIGTAVFFPERTLKDPINFDLSQAVIVHSDADISEHDGRWIISLPHPSGASLWPNKPQNKLLIERAVKKLSILRSLYDF